MGLDGGLRETADAGTEDGASGVAVTPTGRRGFGDIDGSGRVQWHGPLGPGSVTRTARTGLSAGPAGAAHVDPDGGACRAQRGAFGQVMLDGPAVVAGSGGAVGVDDP